MGWTIKPKHVSSRTKVRALCCTTEDSSPKILRIEMGLSLSLVAKFEREIYYYSFCVHPGLLSRIQGHI